MLDVVLSLIPVFSLIALGAVLRRFKVLTEEGAKVMTPMDALRVILDADRYQPIRDRLASLRTPSPVTGMTREGLERIRDELRLEDA